MDWAPASVVRWLFDSEHGDSDRLISRWIFLRTLGLIYFSAFFSLVFQIRGLIGPHAMLVICFACFLSFVSAAQDFSGYQSDGMLLEAGFISLFFAPPGIRPGWGAVRPPIHASLFLLQWEWFRIYFESGIAKIASGDPQWRNLTAMDEYYQN